MTRIGYQRIGEIIFRDVNNPPKVVTVDAKRLCRKIPLKINSTDQISHDVNQTWHHFQCKSFSFLFLSQPFDVRQAFENCSWRTVEYNSNQHTSSQEEGGGNRRAVVITMSSEEVRGILVSANDLVVPYEG